jgi:MoaA/NifB/PqqE/SkfB family radical SAM enzyme
MSGLNMTDEARVQYFLEHMAKNKAFHRPDPESDEGKAEVDALRVRYRRYRTGWRGIPDEAIKRGLAHDFVSVMGVPPSSVDIEVAAVCDLACPFCYRQHIATPDKIMSDALCYDVIDQAAKLGVPSIKLNWRGEPLLHPRLAEFVAYAKRKGILEVSINTNAVTLTPEKSRALIDAGLDVMIFSFDGGTAETYEKMRVGRFKNNEFEHVYENIVAFAKTRSELGAAFPLTRVQMILIGEAYNETQEFYRLFDGVIDDIMVKAYSERGGKFEELAPEDRKKVQHHFTHHEKAPELNMSTLEFWKDAEGNIFYATGRLPCQQIYQRLMVSYDGSVHMCCYDWAAEHPVGYVSAMAYENGMQDYAAVVDSAKRGTKGFKLLSSVVMPHRYVFPEGKTQTLAEIWDGAVLNAVREAHVGGRIDEVPICRKCPLKETYNWQNVV